MNAVSLYRDEKAKRASKIAPLLAAAKTELEQYFAERAAGGKGARPRTYRRCACGQGIRAASPHQACYDCRSRAARVKPRHCPERKADGRISVLGPKRFYCDAHRDARDAAAKKRYRVAGRVA